MEHRARREPLSSDNSVAWNPTTPSEILIWRRFWNSADFLESALYEESPGNGLFDS
jgi:hypothetical protein